MPGCACARTRPCGVQAPLARLQRAQQRSSELFANLNNVAAVAEVSPEEAAKILRDHMAPGCKIGRLMLAGHRARLLQR